jgi:hypothetical protein
MGWSRALVVVAMTIALELALEHRSSLQVHEHFAGQPRGAHAGLDDDDNARPAHVRACVAVRTTSTTRATSSSRMAGKMGSEMALA